MNIKALNRNLLIVFILAVIFCCFTACKGEVESFSDTKNSSQSYPQESKAENSKEDKTNSDAVTDNSADKNVQYLPDDFTNDAEQTDEIKNEHLDGESTKENTNDQKNEDSKLQNGNEHIEYDDNSGWSNGWN